MKVRWCDVEVNEGFIVVQRCEEMGIVFLLEGRERRRVHVIIVVVRYHNNINFRNILRRTRGFFEMSVGYKGKEEIALVYRAGPK